MKLTTPQIRELKLLADGPQPIYGRSRVRLQRRLSELGLARIDEGRDECEITNEGREALANVGKKCTQCLQFKQLVDFPRSSVGRPICQMCQDAAPDKPRATPSRGRGKLCRLCCGLPHRIVGAKCAACGTYKPEE